MRFERKKGIKKVRIQHNKKLFWVIILLLAILIFLIYLIVRQEKAKISMTTDKTNYEQGETIKILVKNGLDKSIWYLDVELGGWNPWWGMQKLEKGNWVEVEVHKPIDGKCLIIVREQVPIEELIKEMKTNAERSDTWTLENCIEVSPIGPKIDLKPLAFGTYRVFFRYGLSKNSYSEKTIYSNKFTIKVSQTTNSECSVDEDCVPATCCHPDSCISAEKAPLCKGIMCSMVCSGPLDCGAGKCGCVEGKCEVVNKGE